MRRLELNPLGFLRDFTCVHPLPERVDDALVGVDGLFRVPLRVDPLDDVLHVRLVHLVERLVADVFRDDLHPSDVLRERRILETVENLVSFVVENQFLIARMDGFRRLDVVSDGLDAFLEIVCRHE